MKRIFFCLLILPILILPLTSLASTPLTAEKDIPHQPTDWTKIIQPGYAPHQEVFAKLTPGMSGEEAKRIVRDSAKPFRERLEIIDTPRESQIIWVWGQMSFGAEGMTVETSQLMVSIKDCRITVVVIQFVGNYPTRNFKQGRGKILGFPENDFGINEDKEK